MLASITKRQRLVLSIIKWHLCEHGRPPTIRHICLSIGATSPNGVNNHLKALCKKVLLKKVPGTRGIYLPTSPEIVVKERDGTIRVGVSGGAVEFSRESFREWLLDQLSALDRPPEVENGEIKTRSRRGKHSATEG